MKVLAFNASPRKSNSISDVVMNRFLEGAAESGAEVESHYVVDLVINGCVGCFSCWWKTPGKCIHRDDMDWILQRIIESNVLYLGTPIYHYNIIHYLQRLRERTLPLSLPKMCIEEEETHHPGRYKNERRTVLAAVCGFPDLSNFTQAKGLFPDATHIFLPAAQTIWPLPDHPWAFRSTRFYAPFPHPIHHRNVHRRLDRQAKELSPSAEPRGRDHACQGGPAEGVK